MRFETENPWIVVPIIFVVVAILVAGAFVGLTLNWNAYAIGLATGVWFATVKVKINDHNEGG